MFHNHRFEIIVEMLKTITTGDFGCEQCVSMHVRHKGCGCVSAHSTAARQKQRATRLAQDSIHPGHKIAHFPEQEEVQLPVITTVQHYSLEGKSGRTQTHEEVHHRRSDKYNIMKITQRVKRNTIILIR